jgi:hypothetical protein
MGTAARGSAADHCLRAKEAIREMLALNPCRNVMIAALQSWPHNRREAGEYPMPSPGTLMTGSKYRPITLNALPEFDVRENRAPLAQFT